MPIPCRPCVALQYNGGALTSTDINAHALIAVIMVSNRQERTIHIRKQTHLPCLPPEEVQCRFGYNLVGLALGYRLQYRSKRAHLEVPAINKGDVHAFTLFARVLFYSRF